jgi:hypothetical protein
MAAEQGQHLVATGLAVETGDRVGDVLGVGDHGIGRGLGVGVVAGVHRERIVAGVDDVAMPKLAHGGLQLRRHRRRRGFGGGRDRGCGSRFRRGRRRVGGVDSRRSGLAGHERGREREHG